MKGEMPHVLPHPKPQPLQTLRTPVPAHQAKDPVAGDIERLGRCRLVAKALAAQPQLAILAKDQSLHSLAPLRTVGALAAPQLAVTALADALGLEEVVTRPHALRQRVGRLLIVIQILLLVGHGYPHPRLAKAR